MGSLLTADYSTTYGALQPGRDLTLRFRAVLEASLAVGHARDQHGHGVLEHPAQQASASVSIDVGGIPGTGLVNGRVWHDADFDRVFDTNEIALEGWTVELYFNDSLAHTARTAADGVYRMSGVEPNYATADRYELRFRRPGAVATTALLGRAHSAFTNDLQRITDIVVLSGSNLQNLNLPIDPNGIVYDALSRAPIAGATVSLAAASGAALPSACFYDPNQQSQVTLADGYYKFDLSFADPACPSGGSYLLQIDAAVGGVPARRVRASFRRSRPRRRPRSSCRRARRPSTTPCRRRRSTAKRRPRSCSRRRPWRRARAARAITCI